MVRFFCPGCWRDFNEDISPCPYCGLDIRAFWDSRDYIEKLILALDHPEPRTPIRAAWLLGKLGERRAVQPLIELFKRTKDVYIAQAVVKALCKIDDTVARQFLNTLTTHPAKIIRDAVLTTMTGSKEIPA